MKAHLYYSMGSTGKSLTTLSFTPSEGEVIAALQSGKLLGDHVRCSTNICGGGSNDYSGNTVSSILHVADEIKKRFGFSPKLHPEC